MMLDDDLMTEQEEAYLLMQHGPSYVAWKYADRWLKRFRNDHPNDERDDYEVLTQVFPNDPERG